MEQVQQLTLSFPADRKYLSLVGSLIHELQRFTPNLPDALGYNVSLAVDEALANVITHAYDNDPSGKVELTVEIGPDRLTIRIRDWGQSYDPDKVREPDFGRPEERGYGLYLIRKLMDEVDYAPDPTAGNQATLVKYL